MDITTPINSNKDLADKVEFFIYNKWNIPNTDILKFIILLLVVVFRFYVYLLFYVSERFPKLL